MFDEWKPKVEIDESKAFRYARLDMATCGECGFSGKVTEFIAEMEQDGWENPEYLVHYCPKCDDGAADDYFPSEESLARHRKTTAVRAIAAQRNLLAARSRIIVSTPRLSPDWDQERWDRLNRAIARLQRRIDHVRTDPA